MTEYIPRIFDQQLADLLSTFGGVLVEGPKWCGKTWTSKNSSKSSIYIADPRNNYATKHSVESDISVIFDGENPRLIDEWQELPEIWDAIRFNIDQKSQRGLYILTGSSNPPKKKTIHSGTGRIARMRMGPMTLYEAGIVKNKVDFEDLVIGKRIKNTENTLDINEIAKLCAIGGWPSNLDLDAKSALTIPRQYVSSLLSEDVVRYDDVDRDTVKMRRLFQSLARNNHTLVKNSTLLADIQDISAPTLDSYLTVLKNLFVINIPAWSPRVRSRIRLRNSEKIHFVDPSIPIAALKLTPEKLMKDLETFGFMFENLVTRDILSYARYYDMPVYHYREASNQDRREYEVDLVIEIDPDNYILIEVKLGARQIDEAEQTLLTIAKKLESKGANPPISMVIISGTAPYSYTTKSGVSVVPIGCLGFNGNMESSEMVF